MPTPAPTEVGDGREAVIVAEGESDVDALFVTSKPTPKERKKDADATVVTSTASGTAAARVQSADVGHSEGTFAQIQDVVHVCFCWGDKVVHLESWQPLLVAINSTLVNTRDPKRVVFHIVTKSELAGSVKEVLSKYLPLAQVQVHFDDALETRIASLVTFRSSSRARKALATPFNFAPFYLDSFLGDSVPRRLIYLDTDVVVKGDIRDLHSTDLHGHAVAAVEDCTQRFEMYINFEVLSTAVTDLPREGIKKDSCVFNRGVFVVDVPRWQALGVTRDIETYMKAYSTSKKDLYHFGMSQPPWLLAVRGRYRRLDLLWNCRGLGRDMIAAKEFNKVIEVIPEPALTAAKMPTTKQSRYISPFISGCAGKAHLLHFNGALKPWRRKSMREDHPGKSGALCATRTTETDMKLVKCAGIWAFYLSKAAEEALQG